MSWEKDVNYFDNKDKNTYSTWLSVQNSNPMENSVPPKKSRKHKFKRKSSKRAKRQRVYGTVFCCSLDLRGQYAPLPNNSIRVNVSTTQMKTSIDRIAFSTMNEQKWKGFACFHNFWRSHLVYKGLDSPVKRAKHVAWWKAQPKPRVNCPLEKQLTVVEAEIDNVRVSVREARERVFVPSYIELVEKHPRLTELRQILSSGKNIAIYDYDGPRGAFGTVSCAEATNELINEALRNQRESFGHGYVLAKLLLQQATTT